MGRWKDGWVQKWMDACMHGWGWMDSGWMGGWKEGWREG